MDSENRPILLIEFVATFKPDFEKLAKIKRLGIDCIQVNIPKSSPEEIEHTFHITTRTKWLYNNEEERTDYFQLPKSYPGGISEIDLEQRKLLEEGFRCRKARIGSLIRRIEIILRGEQYQSIAEAIKSEIRRVESNAKNAQWKLDTIRNESIKRGIEQHQERRNGLEEAKRSFQNYRRELEARYTSRKQEIEREDADLDGKIADVEFKLEGTYLGGEEVFKTVEDLQREIHGFDSRTEKAKEDQESEQRSFKEYRKELENEFSYQKGRIERETRELQHLIETIPGTIGSETDRIEEQIKAVGKEEGGLGGELEELRKRIDQEVESGEVEGNGWFAKEFRRLHDFEHAIKEYKSALEELGRVEEKIETKSRESGNRN